MSDPQPQTITMTAEEFADLIKAAVDAVTPHRIAADDARLAELWRHNYARWDDVEVLRTSGAIDGILHPRGTPAATEDLDYALDTARSLHSALTKSMAINQLAGQIIEAMAPGSSNVPRAVLEAEQEKEREQGDPPGSQP